MTNGIRLGQGKKIKLIVDTILPIQIDGEPFLITEPSTIYITHLMQTPLLYNIDRDRSGKHFKKLTGFNLQEIQKMEAAQTVNEESNKVNVKASAGVEEKLIVKEVNPEAASPMKPKNFLASWPLFSKL